MKEIYYKKVGRRYVPINNEEDPDDLPIGNRLVMTYKNGRTTVRQVDPDLAAMIAAGRYALHTMSNAIYEASKARPITPLLTTGQREAWQKLSEEFGENSSSLLIPSTHDIAQTGVDALIEEAEKTLKNPAVKIAYDNFMLVYKLTKENDNAE